MVAERRLGIAEAERFRAVFAGRVPEIPEVLRALATEYGLPYSDLTDAAPSAELLGGFPAKLLMKHELLPLRRVEDKIELAVGRLFDVGGIDALRAATGENFTLVVAPGQTILKIINQRLGVGAETLDSLIIDERISILEDESGGVDLENAAEDASIIRFVNQILVEAIRQRATDVHLEPGKDELRIRYRIDGVLQEVPTPERLKKFQAAVISRVKIMSRLDIAEKRVPQDGRIKLHAGDGDVDVRVSVIPMIHGEGVVMRLLRQQGALKGVNQLQMGDRDEAILRRLLELPHGIILVTGPTGSGKTTTLYASLQEINDSTRKIITIEDPVEYQIKGLNQIPVSDKTGLTFARGLRSILRHDPDVVLVGEIRDRETAEIAVQASLTGHLVFSTLHTNDSPSAITRLVDMGVEPYLVASSVEAILAQRLIRRICPKCGIAQPDGKRKLGKGCEACRETGYHGRQAIFEMLEMTDPIRRMVLDSASSGEIREEARKRGWRSLSEDGHRLVDAGVTTWEEVMRVTKDSSETY
jgi:general secretion pathway protein E/type IV pilus assembly protein PilB